MQTRRQFLTRAGGAAAGLVLAPTLLRLSSKTASAQAIPGSPTFSGNTTTSVAGPFPLNAGLTVVRVQFNGTTNFHAELVLPQPGADPTGPYVADSYFPLFDQIGAFKGAGAAVVGTPGTYLLTIGSAGAFQGSVEQPLPETVTPVQQTSFSGKGQAVTPYFMLPDGISQVSMQASAPPQAPVLQLIAALYHLDDLGGEAIVGGVQGTDPVRGSTLFDFRDPANQPSFPISLPDDGPYVLAVWNDSIDQSTWTISFA